MFSKIFGNTQKDDNTDADHRVAPNERIYAVGDIHGRHDLLLSILDKIGRDAGRFSDDRKSRIIFLGDYIDRGDHSRNVLETLCDADGLQKALKAPSDIGIDFLAGNHEIALLEFLRDPVRHSGWLNWGGLQTIASFGVVPVPQSSDEELHEIRDALASKVAPYLDFFRRMSKIITSGNTVFVHAGLDPRYTLDEQPDEAAFWGRMTSGDQMGLPGYRMVHGHFAAAEPVSRRDRICVDTGAYYSGRLTAVRLDHTETFLEARR